MKFIVGLLIGGCLVFGWHYMFGVSKAELNREREKAKSALEEVKKTDSEILASEKEKVRKDYAVQLKSAEDQINYFNTELLKIRKELVTISTELVMAQAKLTNKVENVKVIEKPVSKPVVVTAPVAPVPQPVSTLPTVAQPAPQQPATKTTPNPSSFSGPRPINPERSYYGRYRLQKKMDGTIVTNYY